MRRSETFVLGAMAGGVIGWLWEKEIEDYVGKKTHVSEALQAGQETIRPSSTTGRA